MSKINLLTNENYKILEIIYDNTVNLMNAQYCPLSQSEIAKIANINRITCNNIINRLKSYNFLDNENTAVKHYVLTDEAIKIMKILKKL